MQRTYPDAFALKNSGLDAFLYADVGTELNGSPLTILSVLARLGQDPWAEAAKWAALPRAGVVESLAQSIARMPLVPSALSQTRATAERLVQLLPATTQNDQQQRVAKATPPVVPGWVPITILYCVLAVGMALSALLAPKPPQAAATAAVHPMAVPGATGAATPPSRDGAVAGLSAAPVGR